MKKIISLIILVATVYFIVTDGMMVHFDLSQGIQYAFNLFGIFVISPACLFALLGMEFVEEKE